MLFNVIENISICCVFLGISFPLGYREGPDRSLSQTERHSFPAVTNTYKLDAHNDNDNDNAMTMTMTMTMIMTIQRLLPIL